MATKTFTAWKLDVLNAALSDPRIPATHFRLFARVIAALNEHTGIAVISDDTLAAEVPGFAVQSTCYRARKHLAQLGWLMFEAGRGYRATRYRVLDDNVLTIELKRDLEREIRDASRNRRVGYAERTPSPALLQGSDQSQPCKLLSFSPAPMQVVHPQRTPSEISLPSQEIAQDTHAHEPGLGPCGECGEPSIGRGRDGDCYCEKHLRPALRIADPNA